MLKTIGLMMLISGLAHADMIVSGSLKLGGGASTTTLSKSDLNSPLLPVPGIKIQTVPDVKYDTTISIGGYFDGTLVMDFGIRL